jgi:hypothetical protein
MDPHLAIMVIVATLGLAVVLCAGGYLLFEARR